MTDELAAPKIDGLLHRRQQALIPVLDAEWISLAAAPTFATMALLTSVFGGPPDTLCTAALHGWPLSGMIPMYLLMTAFHSAPWLKLISSRRSDACRS